MNCYHMCGVLPVRERMLRKLLMGRMASWIPGVVMGLQVWEVALAFWEKPGRGATLEESGQ